MKRKLHFLAATMASLLLISAVPHTAQAQRLLDETFDYTVGENLYKQGEWMRYGANANDVIKVTDDALVYKGYQNTSNGKAVKLSNTASAEDLQKRIADTGIAEDALYYSALINISSAKVTANPAYFMAFVQSISSYLIREGSTGTEFGRVFAMETREGYYKLGVSRNNTTITYTTEEYEYGKAYLIVVKYKFVTGTTNDEVSLFVNPTLDAEPETPSALYNQSSGSDVSAAGLIGMEVRQGQTASNQAPVLTLDALRVATSWQTLISGEPEEPDTTPSLTVTPATDMNFENVYAGEKYTKQLVVKAKNLTEDITVSLDASSTGEVILSDLTIDKDAAMSPDGYNLTVTLTPALDSNNSDVITFATTGVQNETRNVTWNTTAVTEVATLADLRKMPVDDVVYRVVGDAVVSFATVRGATPYNNVYMQDGDAGLVVIDTHKVLKSLPAGGDKYANIVGTLSLSGTTLNFAPVVPFAAPVSQDNVLEPVKTTLADLAANGATYEGRLVCVGEVIFNKGGISEFTAGSIEAISQEGTSANIRIETESGLNAQPIPTRVILTGVSPLEAGTIITPRNMDDLADPIISSIETTIIKGATSVEVYNVSGVKIAETEDYTTLTKGLYIVKATVNGKQVTRKVVVE